jgi:hypothetical protein
MLRRARTKLAASPWLPEPRWAIARWRLRGCRLQLQKRVAWLGVARSIRQLQGLGALTAKLRDPMVPPHFAYRRMASRAFGLPVSSLNQVAQQAPNSIAPAQVLVSDA